MCNSIKDEAEDLNDMGKSFMLVVTSPLPFILVELLLQLILLPPPPPPHHHYHNHLHYLEETILHKTWLPFSWKQDFKDQFSHCL